jgi:hypothetical protein
MGLMRAVLKSANLERLNARGADLSRRSRICVPQGR